MSCSFFARKRDRLFTFPVQIKAAVQGVETALFTDTLCEVTQGAGQALQGNFAHKTLPHRPGTSVGIYRGTSLTRRCPPPQDQGPVTLMQDPGKRRFVVSTVPLCGTVLGGGGGGCYERGTPVPCVATPSVCVLVEGRVALRCRAKREPQL